MKDTVNKYTQVLPVYLLIFSHMLDTTVVNLLLIRIAPDLGVDVNDSSWVITAFGTGILVSFGFAGIITQIISQRTCFVVSNLIFAVASMGCGITSDPYVFFTFRLLQGFSSGLVVSTSFPILVSLYGKENVPKATAVWVSAISLAPIVGPIFGAIITDLWGWHWVFLSNVPLVIICIFPLLSFVEFKINNPPIHRSLLPGLFSFAVMMFLFQHAIDKGIESNWDLDMPIVLSIFGCLFAGILFSYFNRKTGYQVLAVNMLSNIRFTSYLTIVGFGTGIIFCSTIVFPLWLQMDYGLSIIYAGFIVAVSSFTAAILSPIIGQWLTKQHCIKAAWISLAFILVSFVVVSTHGTESSMQIIVFGRVLLGFGLALFTTAFTTLMMNEVKPENMLHATTLNLVFRVFSSNLMVSAAVYLYKYYNLYHYGLFYAMPDKLTLSGQGYSFAAVLEHVMRTVHTLSFKQVFSLLTGQIILLILLFAYLQWHQNRVAAQTSPTTKVEQG